MTFHRWLGLMVAITWLTMPRSSFAQLERIIGQAKVARPVAAPAVDVAPADAKPEEKPAEKEEEPTPKPMQPE